ncbi:MAG: glutamate synthase [Calditrichaeota bacterium]|nr:MAG: glutamate synthase [Calditrichota bacterium]
MAELFGVDLGVHLQAMVSEYSAHQTIYGYPRRKIFQGYEGFDFSVTFHDRQAATPLGPASGPHTQLAQNIVLAFLGGGRIMELKTIQILDRLEIPRPCIDVRNIGFNVEWSQELRLEDSLREYVNAYVLLKLMEELEILGKPKGDPFYHTIFDISVGYDLKGISSPQVTDWLRRIMNAEEEIARALETLPPKYAHLKKVPIDPHIANSATLSTFHGCPRDEIESIVQYLIAELGLHVMVKLNPTLAGYDFVRETLREKLGYRHIELDPKAFEEDLQFDEGVAMMQRLREFARRHGKQVGAKFTNTLVVKNTQKVFKDEVMYLSGAPLHVISMNLMHRFRSAVGADLPVSFSAGIDKFNFPDAVRCHMKPVTVCTDLLKTGGYTRMFDYLKHLRAAMESVGAHTIEEFILRSAPPEARTSAITAGAANAREIVAQLADNPRYHYEKNRKEPPKIDSHLSLFDCITCNKCLPVCPNAANFSLPIGPVEIPTVNYRYRQGDFVAVPDDVFALKQKAQIANLADFCNECGDCDTYCPEHGGPFVQKPRFFFTEASYSQYADGNGFFLPDPHTLKGRIGEREYLLSYNPEKGVYLWQSPEVELLLDADHRLISGMERAQLLDGQTIDMQPYYIMRMLLDGLLRAADTYPAIMLRQG